MLSAQKYKLSRQTGTICLIIVRNARAETVDLVCATIAMKCLLGHVRMQRFRWERIPVGVDFN
jgi:hypothetical protein